MPDEHYDNPILAELYDIQCGWSEDRGFYLALAGETPPKTILDLGCGTGLICRRYAEQGHDVTGVDPSPAMLEVARRNTRAPIEWVLASAQSFCSPKRFDLIISTGHAFQVLEDDADILAGLTTMRLHLKPDGRAVFESRNPAIDWATRWHGGQTTLDHRGIAVTCTTNVVGWDRDRLTFEQHFTLPDRTLVSTSRLRFATRDEIAALIEQAGLVVDNLWGDWQSGPFDPAASEEMIFSVRLPT